jgi:[methyl-Co(III) methanol-specific corrinoid protein]:coenzyme M methyltransferase
MKPTTSNIKSTPYNLVMSALFKGEKGTRPPVATITSTVCQDLMDIAGISFPQAHLDSNAMAELALAGHEIIGFDTVMPEYSVHQEAAALGCDVDWGNRDMMPDSRNFPHEDFSDVVIPENILEKPAMRVVLDALSILRRHVGGKAAVVGKVMGPWTIAYHMVGTQNFLLHVGLGETDKIKKMLRQLMSVSILFAKAQFKAGADIVIMADHATGNLVGAYHYKELLLPIHQEINASVEGPLILHVCGNCQDRLELFADAGWHGYHFEWQIDSKTAVEKVGKRMCLVGNISNVHALFQGTPEDVRTQARYAIESGVDIIAPECAVPLTTPIENLKALVAAVHEGY